MPRWEGQLRQRRGQVSNLGVDNAGEKASLQYKRSYFVDWRMVDGLKRESLGRWDYLLDSTIEGDPRLVSGRRRPTRPRARGAPAVPARAVLRSRAVGRAVDEGGVRPRSRGAELRLVLRLRARGEQPAVRLRRRARRDVVAQPRVLPPARAAGRRRLRPLRRRVPDPLRLPRHDGRGAPEPPGAPARGLHPRPVRHRLHAGRELLPDGRRAGRHGLPRPARRRRSAADAGGPRGGAARRPLVSGGTPRGEVARPAPRSLPDSRRHGSLLGRERDGARGERDALHLHVQAVGLGPPGPRRPAAADQPGARRGQHPVGPPRVVGAARN